MKSGTTSLWTYLLSHPDILPLASTQLDPLGKRKVVAEKEVRFFNDPGYTTLIEEYGKANAIGYYLDLFPIIPPPNVRTKDLMLMTNQNKISGEATPMYISSPGVAPRIVEALPMVKVIILLRNPIDRAYSDYWFRKNLKITTKSGADRFEVSNFSHSEVFQQCVKAEIKIAEYCDFGAWAENPTVEDAAGFWHCAKRLAREITSDDTSHVCGENSKLRSLCLPEEVKKNCQPLGLLYGIYAVQLLEWVQNFEKERIIVLPSERMFDTPVSVMDEITNFLDLNHFNWDMITRNTFNIINPKSVAGSQLQLETHDPNSGKSLQIGRSDTTSEYPPLDPIVRVSLNSLMLPFNRALATILGDDEFLTVWAQ
eukprot:CAMPEP_0117056966 /NCGR_PEP_ID=MMETSP0472-20121206/39529_1 /TAXON_ID=693140 ORGANISM="Tiarina fusus, Strain LIS" /NCGR_SAMPLE_ID=MMETSP0472 /ASSEMBLY_ACC=CAM_ASM_000603 /LENGTH=368 /DNA_ID=CAMNT_0004773629 /DNA_START=146 /DNA_END=1252 /DNA_ORIENTATION=-